MGGSVLYSRAHRVFAVVDVTFSGAIGNTIFLQILWILAFGLKKFPGPRAGRVFSFCHMLEMVGGGGGDGGGGTGTYRAFAKSRVHVGVTVFISVSFEIVLISVNSSCVVSPAAGFIS
jgi:hypothetical protein